MQIGNDWGTYSTSLKPENITDTSLFAVTVRAWYNEDTYSEIARHNDPDISKRPRLDIEVNGDIQSFYASDDAMVRGGIYADKNYADVEHLRVRNYGDFIGDGLEQVLLKFDLSSLDSAAEIGDIKLVLYGRSGPEFAGSKRLIVIYEPGTGWSSDEVMWSNLDCYVYSFNGLGEPSEPDNGLPANGRWARITNADNEYYGQIARFYGLPPIATEYQLTGEESYAYRAQRIVENFLIDTGDYLSNTTNSAWDGVDDPENPPLRGAFQTTLSSAIRVSTWLDTMPTLMKSRYATGAYCTAVMKSIWDTCNYLTHYNTVHGNWRQTEMEALYDCAIQMPEFKASENWKSFGTEELENVLFVNTLDDGSYIESTDAYGSGAFNGFVNYKEEMMSKGTNVSEKYDDLLHNLAYYQALLYSSDGTSPQYGDSGLVKRDATSFLKVAKWFNDKELEYIVTYGKSGTEPEWTSKTFHSSGVTTLRGGWWKNSPHIFTSVRGGGHHGHRDYNAIVLNAYGRTLLNDSGYFTYDSTDPYRQYGTSTRAHNTVVINNTNQLDFYNADDVRACYGTVHELTTNSAFDYLSQSTPNNENFNHKRTITYIKPNLFIVSDLMEPEIVSNKSNNYKQVWHMHPEANMIVSDKDKCIRSNFGSGGEVIVASADGEKALTVMTDGWCARRYNRVEEAPYGYFEKYEVGDAKMDSVIMPYTDDPTASVRAQRISTHQDASAIKMDIVRNGVQSTGYYYLSYNGNGGSFGEYETDAEVAYVQISSNGAVESIMIKDGKYIKKGSEYIFNSEEKQEELFVNLQGSNTYIEGDIATLDKASFVISKQSAGELYVSDVLKSYDIVDGYIKNIGNGTLDGSDNKVENIIGGVTGGTASGGGSGSGGEKTESKPEEKPGITDNTFKDVLGHWAQNDILWAKQNKIVNGDEKGNFNPENSVKRSEFVAMAIRAIGLPVSSYSSAFEDVSSDDWYADVVQTALNNNIVSKANIFRPNDFITREEMAKIAAILSEIKKIPQKEMLQQYTDSYNFAPWAIDYIDTVTSKQIMNGRNDGRFDPKANTTRAEAVVVIKRIINR